MKDYIMPELEYIDFSTEKITDDNMDGDTDQGVSDVPGGPIINPYG